VPEIWAYQHNGATLARFLLTSVNPSRLTRKRQSCRDSLIRPLDPLPNVIPQAGQDRSGQVSDRSLVESLYIGGFQHPLRYLPRRHGLCGRPQGIDGATVDRAADSSIAVRLLPRRYVDTRLGEMVGVAGAFGGHCGVP
jgi:hypothetical protein